MQKNERLTAPIGKIVSWNHNELVLRTSTGITHFKMVPETTCTMEPYCVSYRVCRQVPVVIQECEPECLPACERPSFFRRWLCR